MNTIGERIIFLRNKRDLSQISLAKQIGISKMTLYKYEKNVSEPRGETIAVLANTLHTSTDFLLGRIEDPRIGESVRLTRAEKNHLAGYRQLAVADRIRIDERMAVLLEQVKGKK